MVPGDRLVEARQLAAYGLSQGQGVVAIGQGNPLIVEITGRLRWDQMAMGLARRWMTVGLAVR